MKKKSLARRGFLAVDGLIMIFLGIVCLYPMLYVLFASLSDSNLLMAHRGLLLAPIETNLDAYKAVLDNSMIGISYLNTIFIVIVGVTINIIMTSLGAYFLSRKSVMLKNGVMVFVMFTMFLTAD